VPVEHGVVSTGGSGGGMLGSFGGYTGGSGGGMLGDGTLKGGTDVGQHHSSPSWHTGGGGPVTTGSHPQPSQGGSIGGGMLVGGGTVSISDMPAN
jgi:hypothetical protein